MFLTLFLKSHFGMKSNINIYSRNFSRSRKIKTAGPQKTKKNLENKLILSNRSIKKYLTRANVFLQQKDFNIKIITGEFDSNCNALHNILHSICSINTNVPCRSVRFTFVVQTHWTILHNWSSRSR